MYSTMVQEVGDSSLAFPTFFTYFLASFNIHKRAVKVKTCLYLFYKAGVENTVLKIVHRELS